MGLVLVVCKSKRSLHLSSRILKVYLNALTGSVLYIVRMVSTTHHYLKAVSLEKLRGVGKTNRMHMT